MVMMGLEFAGDIPFGDVYVHSVVQAPDGRRMSKSLGTGIDPLDEIAEHGADALRFGLLAMSSSQDVRYSAEKVKQGRDLANKMWNASRLVLLNVADAAPAPRPERPEDRWILSRLERTVADVTARIDRYDFAGAAQEVYRFFWSELCDWYLEIVKPRLYEAEEAVSANLLWALGRTLALAHPMIPFVTEEIHSFLPSREGHLAVEEFPESDETLIDASAESEMESAFAVIRSVRRWRDLVGVPAGAVLLARTDEELPLDLVTRLARVSFEPDGGEPVATIGPVQVLSSQDVDTEEARRKVGERIRVLESEVSRAEGKLANDGFVSNAPPEVVEAEREKLAAYRAELDELR
jgi:valyl-tRNA synthetase